MLIPIYIYHIIDYKITIIVAGAVSLSLHRVIGFNFALSHASQGTSTHMPILKIKLFNFILTFTLLKSS